VLQTFTTIFAQALGGGGGGPKKKKKNKQTNKRIFFFFCYEVQRLTPELNKPPDPQMEKTLRKQKRSFLSVFQWLATIRQKISQQNLEKLDPRSKSSKIC
jgi:prolipoprotein diacylglyceryltransferase